jgi:hypothetical protein
MDQSQKQMLRAAARIHQGLLRRARKPQWCLPAEAWAEITGLASQIEVARSRGWHHAAAIRTEDMARATESCQRQLGTLASELRAVATSQPLATAADIYRDLLALQGEFEEISCDLEEHEVRATTAPIELEGFYLGRFEIRLQWERLHLSSAYRVVALDPQPSSQREEVTHPHVSSEQLCEGDGTTAIRSALDQGRIGDLFLIVLNLLRTYSQGNAYVELDDWEGSTTCCSSCDSSCTSDGCYCCHGCDTSLCGECVIACNSCGEDYCSGCISGCTQCDDDFCSACLKKCRKCHVSVCPNCLQEGDLCRKCFDNQQSAEDQDDFTTEPAINQPPGIAAIAIQPHRMGQAAVSPRPRDERGRWVRRNAA